MVSLDGLDMVRPLQWEGFEKVNFQTKGECQDRLYQEYLKVGGGEILRDQWGDIQWQLSMSTFACAEFEFDPNEISIYKKM